MAKEKKSFIMYCDAIHTIERLPDQEAGQLFKHLLRYVNDQDPICDNPLVEIAFEPIKQQLKRDLRKFEEIKKRRSIAGKVGANKRWQEMANDSKEWQTHTNDSNRIQTHTSDSKAWQTIAKIAVSDNDNDNVNDIKDSNVIFNDVFSDLLSFSNATFKTKRTVFSTAVKQKYKARFKEGYTIEMVKRAMVNASKSKHHLETGYKYCTLEFFSRPDKLELWSSETEVKPAYNPRA